ncbi:MAG: hypothetical protein IJI97_08340 [Clostridia bacterium]|nr:hypothetical protein [Clostridia bacterium]
MSYIDQLMKQLKEACKPMEETTTITFGTVLDLLGRDETEVTLYTYDEMDYLTGRADSELWGGLEERQISFIKANGEDNLCAWLHKEAGDGTD